jgi:GNAT superfamily N-acetyltransferase
MTGEYGASAVRPAWSARLRLQRHGSAGVVEVDGVVLGACHLDLVETLHHRVLSTLGPGLLNKETRAFFADHLGPAGVTLGVLVDGQLIACAIVGLPAAEAEYNFGRHLGLAGDQLALVAHLDGVYVDADWRGSGLHRQLSEQRMAIAREKGRRHMVTTVAPGNVYSWRNLFALGLVGKVLKPMFALGHMRYVLHRDLKIPASVDMGKAISVPADDVDAQKALLERGFWAVSGDVTDGGAVIVLAPAIGVGAEPPP